MILQISLRKLSISLAIMLSLVLLSSLRVQAQERQTNTGEIRESFYSGVNISYEMPLSIGDEVELGLYRSGAVEVSVSDPAGNIFAVFDRYNLVNFTAQTNGTYHINLNGPDSVGQDTYTDVYVGGEFGGYERQQTGWRTTNSGRYTITWTISYAPSIPTAIPSPTTFTSSAPIIDDSPTTITTPEAEIDDDSTFIWFILIGLVILIGGGGIAIWYFRQSTPTPMPAEGYNPPAPASKKQDEIEQSPWFESKTETVEDETSVWFNPTESETESQPDPPQEIPPEPSEPESDDSPWFQ